MQAVCPGCQASNDLFSSYVIARHAYPKKNPAIQVLCPSCGMIFESVHGKRDVRCSACKGRFDPERGPASGTKTICQTCKQTFTIIDAVQARGKRPAFRLYGKLVLTKEGEKE